MYLVIDRDTMMLIKEVVGLNYIYTLAEELEESHVDYVIWDREQDRYIEIDFEREEEQA